jgi:hypothetical protein
MEKLTQQEKPDDFSLDKSSSIVTDVSITTSS